jgi:hypothetical protein
VPLPSSHSFRQQRGVLDYVVFQKVRRTAIQYVRRTEASWSCLTNLGLSRLAFMVRNSNFIEETVKLPDDCRDLRGQVAGVHDDGARTRVSPFGLRQKFKVYAQEVAKNVGRLRRDLCGF